MFSIPWNQHPVDYGVVAHPTQPGFPITEFGSLKEGNWYTKLGQTTSVTTGVCNGALACCNWKERCKIQDDHSVQGVDSADITEEFVVVSSIRKGEASREQTCFADNGDSGSFVLDHEARVCGLLYGGVTSFFDRNRYFANAGLVMNMPDLTESIRLETMARDGNAQVCSAGVLGLPDYERG